MNRTRFGRMIRTTALDMDMARLVGIPGAHHRRRGLHLGSMLAGSRAAGGALFLADPTMGGALA